MFHGLFGMLLMGFLMFGLPLLLLGAAAYLIYLAIKKAGDQNKK